MVFGYSIEHPTRPNAPTEPFLVGLSILLHELMDQVLHQACVFYDPSSATVDNRSKKRIKGQNFCQTIEYQSFHRSGYLSNDRYMLFEML